MNTRMWMGNVYAERLEALRGGGVPKCRHGLKQRRKWDEYRPQKSFQSLSSEGVQDFPLTPVKRLPVAG